MQFYARTAAVLALLTAVAMFHGRVHPRRRNRPNQPQQ